MGAKISKKLSDPIFILNEKVGLMPKVQPPRWESCLASTDHVIGDVAGKWFVKAAFGEASKVAAETMIKNIKAAFLRRLPSIDWIDDKTRTMAVEKVNHSLSLSKIC